jgi:hypothetical protein
LLGGDGDRSEGERVTLAGERSQGEVKERRKNEGKSRGGNEGKGEKMTWWRVGKIQMKKEICAIKIKLTVKSPI